MTRDADSLKGLPFDDLVLRATVADDGEAEPAVIEMGRAAGPRTVDLGIRWLGDPSPVRRSRGAILLSQFGEVALEAGRVVPSAVGDALVAAAKTEADCHAIGSMVMALCRCRVEEGLPWLLSLSGSADLDLLRILACCLPEYGESVPGVVDCLRGLLDHPDEEVRDWASFGFAHGLTASDSSALRQRLLDLAAGDDPPLIRYQAILALALRGDRRVIPHLATALLTPLTRDEADLVDFTELTTAAARLPDESLLPGLRSWAAGTNGPGSFWNDPLDVGADPELTDLIDRIAHGSAP